VARPDPIPNSAVKHRIADGSACLACARVGCRRIFLSFAPISSKEIGALAFISQFDGSKDRSLRLSWITEICDKPSVFHGLTPISTAITDTFVGVLVYRLGHGPLKAERRVRFPCALPSLIINALDCSRRSSANTSTHIGRCAPMFLDARWGRKCTDHCGSRSSPTGMSFLSTVVRPPTFNVTPAKVSGFHPDRNSDLCNAGRRFAGPEGRRYGCRCWPCPSPCVP